MYRNCHHLYGVATSLPQGCQTFRTNQSDTPKQGSPKTVKRLSRKAERWGVKPALLPPYPKPLLASTTTTRTPSPTMHTPTQPPAQPVQVPMEELTLQLEILSWTTRPCRINYLSYVEALDGLSNTRKSANASAQQPLTKPTTTPPFLTQ